MATFGNEDIEASTFSIEDTVRGTLFSCPAVGVADSIDFVAYVSNANTKIKAMLYNADRTLLGTTDETIFGSLHTYDWRTVTFSAPKPNLAIANYYITAWADDTTYTKADTTTGTCVLDPEVYDGPPNPVGADTNTRTYSMHCNYTPGGAGVTVKKGSSLASTMTQMLNSKMLFDFHNRMPKLAPRQIT